MRILWTDDEVAILRASYATMIREELQKLIPNRSWSRIQQKAEALGIRRAVLHVPWTERQLEQLKVLYPSGERIEELCAVLQHSPKAIKAAAVRLTLRRTVRQVPHSPSRREWWNEGSLLGHLSEAERGYIAGIFDGEGTIGLQIQRGEPRVAVFKITTTDPFLVEWLKEKIPVGSIYDHPAYKQNGKHIYNFRLSTVPAIKFCQEIAPYLVIKKAEAELIGEALKAGFSPLTTEQRWKLRDQIRSLKTKARVNHHQPVNT